MSSGDGERFELAGPTWPGFTVRTVVLAASSSLPYDEGVWHDALVVVLSGHVELETIAGARRSFGPGDVLFFGGLRLFTLHNRGREQVALQTVSRRAAAPGKHLP